MSAPRMVLPGATYLVTRRCTQRQFLLRPSRLTNAILAYCLALASQRYRVQLHAFCFLSNHAHYVLTDPDAVLPEFMRYLNELIARAINSTFGRWENLWAPGSYSAVLLVSPADLLDKTAYVLANPVTAGLVPRSRRWPGLISEPRNVDGPPITVARPERFFRSNGPAPESCALQLVRPPGFETTADFVDAVELGLHRRQDAAAAERRASGIDFMGVRAVLRQEPTDSPTTVEPRRRLNPRIAAGDRSQRIAALQRLKAFLCAYRDAWHQLCSGAPGTQFPPGTYWLRVHFGVAVLAGVAT